MKRLILFFMATFISLSSYSQSFDGVPVSGTLESSISAFKAKGYKLKKYMVDAGKTYGAIVQGSINLTKIEVFIIITPKSKKVCKYSVYFPELSTWGEMESEYNKYLGILINKYGEPDNSFSFFKSPYKEGDGFEVTAVETEHAIYSAFWNNAQPNMTVAVSISKWKQINIIYENNAMMEVKQREDESAIKNTF